MKRMGRRMERVRPKREVESMNEKRVKTVQVIVVLKRWENVMGHLGLIYIGS